MACLDHAKLANSLIAGGIAILNVDACIVVSLINDIAEAAVVDGLAQRGRGYDQDKACPSKMAPEITPYEQRVHWIIIS
jgi:hypothetical protein